MIIAANEAPPEGNPSPDVISEEQYGRLDYKNGYCPRGVGSGVREFSSRTPVFTLYNFNGAKSVYMYSYIAFFEGESMGSWGVPV